MSWQGFAMWRNFWKMIISLLPFMSGKTTRQLVGQVDEIRASLGEIKSSLNGINAYEDELKADLSEIKSSLNKINACQEELNACQEEVKACRETEIDTICRGLAMIINSQNLILQRLDDLESNIKEIKKKEKKI
jgi:DNA repair exonuclease SbcCD ATPase subunit